ncbi:toxic anion resistance protein [Streptococcus dysgalactiae]|uniref:toxic anion resistance protein n=1 Tax=Streptococcus dysgalactiae TaxID=1334 RepID=UPI001CF4F930|nr:toxic anion resistance protein [Streptococcus dysgalactiae]MCB2831336.1 toxic anion resistance protein [Streptococcus dysgalactiae subsp. dysgalactiae]MCB2834377.1 toxic anion resistance protein [Streptococcus dysgalactiae subsp. dysgalactiae]MCB2836995.1 toxic anion resistance protein [Streptococcus dysgalactiae subsp. dysgalactiae]MCB2838543.1 toxic anion resistance protein [Streptococcus dysgalactiae subsp. dysgalactiae]MCB2848200.1 toxic anion resistance protein [Streptococcus dysgalact
MSEFNFDIDAIADKAISKSDKTTEIITEQSNNDEKNISFFEKLSSEQQTAIMNKVPTLVDSFMVNQNSLLDFGQSAVEDVNTTVHRILKEQKKLQIPQVDDLLKNTNQELNGFVKKYKDIGPAELDRKPNLIQKIFKQGKKTLQEFYFDAQSIEQKMDNMAADVVKQENILARNIVSAELLIEDNTKSIENLVGVIAFVEASQQEATKRAQALQTELAALDNATPEHQRKTDLLARTTEVINTLEQQHTEYLSRLFVAWATTPQMRNLVKVSSDMRQKLGMLRRNTIPTMKLSIAQLGMMQQSIKSGVTADAIINANNAALQMLAETSKEAIPALERSAQNPTMSITSVTTLVESLVAQNNGIISAIEQGRKKRAQLENVIVKSAETINDSIKLRDQQIVKALLNESKEMQKTVENTTSD